MERIVAGVGRPGRVGRFRPEQIAQRSTWSGEPDSLAGMSTLAALNKVTMQRHHSSTTTIVNPLDPVYEYGRWCQTHEDTGEDCGCPRAAMRY